MRDKIDKYTDDKIVDIIYSQFLEKPENIVSVEIFRKYISYAKKLKPKLEIDNIDLLKEFYHETRKKSLSKESNMTGMPIGARHLQGVIRLAEAAAKIRLSDTVDIEDIDLAKKLFYESLVKIGLDTSSGLIDMARMGEGKTVSKRKLYDIAIELINKISISSGNEIKDVELRQLLLDNGLSERECGDTIYSLNREGKIIKNNNVWKIL
jgi:DNA replicative helicase MCM subunit Mcm2 (Cdc46/Mcm family)